MLTSFVCAATKPAFANNGPPSCALVDSAKLPLTAILEARLLNNEGATWVERSQIDRILAEQELQSSFGAQGVQSRAALGKALKADVLVLLRSAKNPEPAGPAIVECVVCETRRGLRLKTMSIAMDQNQEETAGALEKLVLDGLKKYAEKIETIVAVPPFLSEDLGFEFNYLQSAFAKVVEERLLAQPGLLVVELGEAQAIAKELVLAGDAAVDRRPPLYVVGRYRHDGIGQNKSVRLSLKLMKSEEQLTLKGIKDLPPPEVPAWIVKKTDELLPLLSDKQIAATGEFSAEREATALANRARQFMKVGNWPEALSLLEAALLLRPDDSAILLDAVGTTAQLIPFGAEHFREPAQVKFIVANCQRGLEHLEKYMRDAPNIKDRTPEGPADLTLKLTRNIATILRRRDVQNAPELQELVHNARKFHCDTLLRIAYARGKARFADRSSHLAWDALAVSDLSAAEKYAVLERVAEEWRDLSDLHTRLLRMTFGEFTAIDDSAEYRRFLEQLKASPRPDLKLAAKTIQQRFEQGLQRRLEYDKQREVIPQSSTTVDPLLERVALQLERRLEFIEGSFPTESRGDIFYRSAMLARRQPPDQLKIFHRHRDPFFIASSVVCDGRYIWIAGVNDDKAPGLLAVDFEGKAIEFTSDDGIPKSDDRQAKLRLAPVAPGKVCVAGFSGRSWVATAEVADEGKRKFDIFFEAREVVTGTEQSHVTNPQVVFTPTRLFTLKNAKGESVIVVGRESRSTIVSTRPLIVDPQAKTARVATFTCTNWGHGGDRWVTQGEDGIYFYELDPNPPNPQNLMRVRWPGNEKEKAVVDCPQGMLAFDKRGLHVIGKKWWLADVSTGTVKKLVDSPPWVFKNPYWERGTNSDADFGIDYAKGVQLKMVYPTEHYGPLVKAGQGNDERGVVYYRLKE
ncbi:hypothetical protein [Anatilimnocola floriformis]|uniref:hypothetical protein n=1 Tax=Anatilimnocola floriformis TaxID=2948575 RepID=UPI0020C51CBC|nr:hypothetical protein [Anatilimnocola floriformis]